MSKIILFNKPYGVISQFRAHETHPTLANYITDKSLRIAGRLDTDSEGLMLLTDNGKINAAITHPQSQKFKTYFAQVEGEPTPEKLQQLQQGVTLKDGVTLPAKVALIDEPALWQRQPPVRFRKTVPTYWLKISICEGKNRQVRRMTAAVGLPTLRLVRMEIDRFKLANIALGSYQSIQLTENEHNDLLATHAQGVQHYLKNVKFAQPSKQKASTKQKAPTKRKAFGKPISKKAR